MEEENPYAAPLVPEEATDGAIGKDGKHCPNCGAEISVWRIVAASTPRSIICLACGARLRFAPDFDVIVAYVLCMTLTLVIAVGVGFATSEYVNLGEGIMTPLIASALTAIIGWAGIEYRFSAFLRNRRSLKVLHYGRHR